MADIELYQMLVQRGIDDKLAQQIQNNINGTDLINLVNSLNSSKSSIAIFQANKILKRYGASIQEGKMNKNLNDLYALYTGAKTSGEEIPNLTHISESTDTSDHLLALEGFNYYTMLDGKLSEQLIDWLEENKVEFLTNGEGHFHIKCNDRDHAYKVGRTISGIVRRERLVRDSIKPGEDTVKMNEKNLKSQINKTKQQIADLKPRDPSALAAAKLNAKNGGPIDPQRKTDQKDQFNRNAKHKKKDWSESMNYKIGDNVMVNDCKATIKIPKGPDGTVGVVMDGQLEMVQHGDISRLDESIMGLKTISPLFRLRELAGLPPAPASEVTPVLPPPPASDMDDLDISDLDDSSAGDMSGMDDIGLDEPTAPIDGGIPGDLPPPDSNPEVPVGITVPVASPAMSAIEDHLNNIQQQLASITLGEYKSLVHKLQDLTNQIQVMGRDYLGEQRKKKI